MSRHRIIALVSGIVSLVCSFFLYQEFFRFLGFPDGFVTALERAEQLLFGFFIAENTLVGLLLCVLGFRSSSQKTVHILLLILLLSVVLVFGVDAYLRVYLQSGGGG